ncbi:MAG: hypothetical protein RR796_00630 [Victivallaceae bacterium]
MCGCVPGCCGRPFTVLSTEDGGNGAKDVVDSPLNDPQGASGGTGTSSLSTAPVITSQPLSGDLAGAIQSVSQVVGDILNSQKTEDGAEACYTGCAPWCRQECGCPGCGCPLGECGCGSVGSCLCHTWDMFCTGGRGQSREDITQLVQTLEEEYGPLVLLKAEKLTGIDLDDRARQHLSITRQEQSDLNNACKSAKLELEGQVAFHHKGQLVETSQKCLDKLNLIPGMVTAIKQGVSEVGTNDDTTFPPEIKILTEEGQVCIGMNEEEFFKNFLTSGYFSSQTGHGPGVVTLCSIYILVLAILRVLCKGGRCWLTEVELLALVVFLLAFKGYSVKDPGDRDGPIPTDHILQSALGLRVEALMTENASRRSGPSGPSGSDEEPRDQVDGCEGGGWRHLLQQAQKILDGAVGGGPILSPDKQWQLLRGGDQSLVKCLLTGERETQV